LSGFLLQVQVKSGKSLKRNQYKNLIEVSYLLISLQKRKLIYITTIPDLRKNYYATKSWLGEDSLNIHDFRSFHFGEITRVTSNSRYDVQFISKDLRLKDTWKLAFDSRDDTFSVESIMEEKDGDFTLIIPVDKALADAVLFERIYPDPVIVYFKKSKNNKGLPEKPSPLFNNTFYIAKKCNRKYNLLFFIRGRENSIIRKLFTNKRIIYLPDPLFDRSS
jgi:hypothetical protein